MRRSLRWGGVDDYKILKELKPGKNPTMVQVRLRPMCDTELIRSYELLNAIISSKASSFTFIFISFSFIKAFSFISTKNLEQGCFLKKSISDFPHVDLNLNIGRCIVTGAILFGIQKSNKHSWKY